VAKWALAEMLLDVHLATMFFCTVPKNIGNVICAELKQLKGTYGAGLVISRLVFTSVGRSIIIGKLIETGFVVIAVNG
jgi:hypothetical protein